MLHLHLTSIVLAIILFVVVYVLYKKDSSPENKLPKILHMVLRLFYILVIASGLIVYIQNMDGISNAGSHMEYGLKVLFGLFSVALMESTLVRLKKQSPAANKIAIVAVVLIIITVGLGTYLPLGVL
ncbi:YisL family protein [Corticicoccus populi]|uniref:YisL family protein n=1 Tax=Corticicoccus populi TaxID=1812821 RepID=A0ABW5WUZ7_9STAP